MAGSTLLLGLPPEPLLRGLAASAAALDLFCPGEEGAQAKVFLESLGPAPVSLLFPGEAFPAHQNLVVSRLPPGESWELLERALGSTADGGMVLATLLTPPEGALRLRRLLLAHACASGRENDLAQPGRLLFLGRRTTQQVLDLELPLFPPLPVAVVVGQQPSASSLEGLLCDLLLGQLYPPGRVVILDPGDGALARSLARLPAMGAVDVITLKSRGRGFGRDLATALEEVPEPFVILLDGRERLAPNALVALGLALEQHPEWPGVAAAVGERDESGGFRAWHAPRPPESLPSAGEAGSRFPPLGALLHRTAFLRELLSNSPTPGNVHQIWERLGAATRPFGRLDLPLLSLPPDP